MTLDGLRALLEVIEAGSINRAATRLEIPRSTLTRRLEALEAWFGTPLLTVSRDGAQPTAAGLRLARGAETLLGQAAVLDASVRLGLESPTRPVRVAIPPGIHPGGLAVALKQAQRRLPDVQLHIRTQADPFQDADDHPDFVLSFGRPRFGDYRTFQLVRMRYALRASSMYVAEHGLPTTTDALGDHALWAWEGALLSSGTTTGVLLRDGSVLPVAPQVVLNDVHQLHVALQQGLCLALVPSSPFQAIEPDEVEVLEGELGGAVALWVAVPERNVDLPWTRRLVTELRAFFAMFAQADDPPTT
jgi:DNA-binding transcriptional LysR family regulator